MKLLSSLLVLTLIHGTSFATGQRPSAANPPTNTDSPAVNLIKNCQSTVADYFSVCAGHLSGIAFGVDAASSQKETREICFPVFPLPLKANIETFTKYVERHPDKLTFEMFGFCEFQTPRVPAVLADLSLEVSDENATAITSS
jgi:hypothetical protein